MFNRNSWRLSVQQGEREKMGFILLATGEKQCGFVVVMEPEVSKGQEAPRSAGKAWRPDVGFSCHLCEGANADAGGAAKLQER